MAVGESFMMPRAKKDLLICNHVKRGKKWISVLDPSSRRVILLESWEHAVLALLDGTKTRERIVEILLGGVDGAPISEISVERCIAFFESEGILEDRPTATTSISGERSLEFVQTSISELLKDRQADPKKLRELLSGTVKIEMFEQSSVPAPKSIHIPKAIGGEAKLPESRLKLPDKKQRVESVLETQESPKSHSPQDAVRLVFENLRLLGVEARKKDSEPNTGAIHEVDTRELNARRKNHRLAERFDFALERLGFGDLELAEAHFQSLLQNVPESVRLRAFVEAIRSAKQEITENTDTAITTRPFARAMAESVEPMLEEAIAYGRCPKCISRLEPNSSQCFSCGFKLRA